MKEKIIEDVEEVIEERQFYPTYPEPNLRINLWQIMQKRVGNPLCWACNWYINSPLSSTKIKKLLSAAYGFIRENFRQDIEKKVKVRVEKRLPEFKKDDRYFICRWDLFWLVKIELKNAILNSDSNPVKNLKKKFKEFTKKFIALYNWTLPKGGAGGDVW